MRKATQEDIDYYFDSISEDKDIYPYISVDTYNAKKKLYEDDWYGLFYINEKRDCLMQISFSRSKEISIEFSCFSKNPFQAGKAYYKLKEVILRYGVVYLNSCCHASNVKSLNINRKIFVKEWGIEENGAWNQLTGKFEDLYHFRIRTDKLK